MTTYSLHCVSSDHGGHRLLFLQRSLVRGRGLVWWGWGPLLPPPRPPGHPGEHGGGADVARDGGHRRQRPGEEAGGAADDGGHEVRRDIMRLLVTRGQRGVTIIRVRTWGRLDTLTTAHTVRESANTTHYY